MHEHVPHHVPYPTRKLSYATSYDNTLKATTIRSVEWMTAKLSLMRRLRRFERDGRPDGQAFWSKALDIMGIELTTPESVIARIPKTGPVVLVANHPHGLVDGMVLAELIGRVREDYKILTRSFLTGVAEIDRFMIPVPFPNEEDALQQNLIMRKRSMEHLNGGGLVALFPSGVVASSDTAFGPVIERPWNAFTAKMIQRSNATVVPVFFPGANSRWYQVANSISATLRQSLLLYEVRHALDKPQRPMVGPPITPDLWQPESDNQTSFMDWLRDQTLALAKEA
ncbi:MAG: lysophospholipid acyltransferase family protein [Pseudomonadota bacterium]